MANLQLFVKAIGVIKHSLYSEGFLNSLEEKSKLFLEREFLIETEVDNNFVSIQAGITIKVKDADSKEIELQNLVVETEFFVKDLKSHIKDDGSDDLTQSAMKALVNLSYHHLRAIQAQLLNNKELFKYLVPLFTITDDEPPELVSRKEDKENIG